MYFPEFHEGAVTTSVSLCNQSSTQSVCWKMRCSHVGQYVVGRSKGTLKPNQTALVNIVWKGIAAGDAAAGGGGGALPEHRFEVMYSLDVAPLRGGEWGGMILVPARFVPAMPRHYHLRSLRSPTDTEEDADYVTPQNGGGADGEDDDVDPHGWGHK